MVIFHRQAATECDFCLLKLQVFCETWTLFEGSVSKKSPHDTPFLTSFVFAAGTKETANEIEVNQQLTTSVKLYAMKEPAQTEIRILL